MFLRSSQKAALLAGTALFLILSTPGSARAQDKDKDIISLTVKPSDKAAADSATNLFRAAEPVRSAHAKAAKLEGLLDLHPKHGKAADHDDFSVPAIVFPGDLTFLGGNIVASAQSHPIFLLPNGSCPIATCWGDPAGFLHALTRSDLVHVTDQYTGFFSPDRYTLGFSATLSYTPPSTPLTDAEIRGVVVAAAEASGDSGYGHIFHIFLPPGQDECFDSTFTDCYSPDKPSSFGFCAYHSSFDVTGIGHLLYTVQPFQNVPSCQVRPGTPNGQLTDSTNSTLSHETIETITDPDGDAWRNVSDNSLALEEIADECQLIVINFNTGTVFGAPFVYNIGDKLFATQPEYSNELHACTVTNRP
jgi:hypothetical protein